MFRVFWTNHSAKLSKSTAILDYFRHSIENCVLQNLTEIAISTPYKCVLFTQKNRNTWCDSALMFLFTIWWSLTPVTVDFVTLRLGNFFSLFSGGSLRVFTWSFSRLRHSSAYYFLWGGWRRWLDSNTGKVRRQRKDRWVLETDGSCCQWPVPLV